MIDKETLLAQRILIFYINKKLKGSFKKQRLHKEFTDIKKLAKNITLQPLISKPIQTPQLIPKIQPTQIPIPQPEFKPFPQEFKSEIPEYQPSIKLEPLPEPKLKKPITQHILQKYPIISTPEFTFSTAEVSDKYVLKEPYLSASEQQIIQELKLSLKSVIQKNPYKITHHNFLEKRIKKLLKRYNQNIVEETIHRLKYYIIRDIIGYGKIESLICDSNIKSISISLQDPVLVSHKTAGRLQTNIKFKTEQQLNSLIQKIAKRAHQEVSKSSPILSTTIGNSKIQATLGTELAEPKLTIIRITQ